jgi:hypothetical protein
LKKKKNQINNDHHFYFHTLAMSTTNTAMGLKPSKEEVMQEKLAQIQETLIDMTQSQVELERNERAIVAQLKQATIQQNTSRMHSLGKRAVQLHGQIGKLGQTIEGIVRVRTEVSIMQATMASLEKVNSLTSEVTGVENINTIMELVKAYKSSTSDLTAQSAMLSSAFDTSTDVESAEEKAAIAEMIERVKDEVAMHTAVSMPSVPHGRTVLVEGEQVSEQQLEARVRKLDV